MATPKSVKKDDGPVPSLKNMRRILMARYPDDDSKPGTASPLPATSVTGSYADMKAKGLTNLPEAEFNLKKDSETFKNGAYDNTPRSGTRPDFSKVGNMIGTYGSNILNSFRKPPTPPVPENVSPVTLNKVNLDNARNEANRASRTADLEAERSGLDANSVQAVKAANLSTKLNAVNSVNTQEANINSQIGNQQSQINANVDAQNVGQRNQWNQQLTEMKVAQQREQSQNQANAGDKFIAEQNERAKAQLEMDKYKIGIQLFKDSGVYNRFLKAQGLTGNTDPTGINKQYETKNNYRTGGILRKVFHYADGGELQPSPLSKRLIGTPRYDMQTLSGPSSATDSAMYDIHYQLMRNKDPQALRNMADYNKYGIPMINPNGGKINLSIYDRDVNRINAYRDALNPNVMSDEEVHRELYKPLVTPADTKRKRK